MDSQFFQSKIFWTQAASIVADIGAMVTKQIDVQSGVAVLVPLVLTLVFRLFFNHANTATTPAQNAALNPTGK